MPMRKRMPRYRKKQMRRRGGMKRRGGRKFSKYHGLRYMKETILKSQVVVNAGATTFTRKYACNFIDISNTANYLGVSPQTAIPALFGRYCITGVKWTFIPLYTQTTQGGAGAARVCYAINRDPQDQLTGESDIVRQDDCKFTNTTRKFSVYVKHPKPSIAATAQQMNPNGLLPSQYAAPTVGNQRPNQVAFTTGDNKWIWLPTRTQQYDDPSGNPVSDQYPDHLGLDVVITSPIPIGEGGITYYNVYQTLYFALKEQD